MASSKIKVKGCFRVQLTENGKVVGDSGWKDNMTVNLGFNQYLVLGLMGNGSSKKVTHMAIGSGAAPASNATTLPNDLTGTGDIVRVAVTTSSIASHTAQFTAQFASTLNTTTQTISNLGLFNTSAGGTIFAGQTFDSSQWNSNQDVNCTYQIRFATA
jgi:hypothetical protein